MRDIMQATENIESLLDRAYEIYRKRHKEQDRFCDLLKIAELLQKEIWFMEGVNVNSREGEL